MRFTNGAFDISVQPVLAQIRTGKDIDPRVYQLVDFTKIMQSGSTIVFQIPGMAVTFDGIAKGYVVDQGAETLKQLGFDKVLVEAGGDLAVSGSGSDHDGWKIGIASPRPKNSAEYLAKFSISSGAVATSGDYVNYFTEDKLVHHIIDPGSYRSPIELSSVTVYAPTALEADALSIAIMVIGAEAGLKLANELDKTEALVVTKDMKLHHTMGFPGSKKG